MAFVEFDINATQPGQC